MDLTQMIETIPPSFIIPMALIWLLWELIKRALPDGDDSEDDHHTDALG